MLTHQPHAQQGATLVIALIFMVLLTVISLSSLHSSSFEIKIARSVKSQIDAFTAAEDALASGENFITGLSDISAFPNGDGFYQGASLASLSGLNDLLTGFTGSAAATSVGNGLFYVEYLGSPAVSGNSGASGTPSIDTQHLFRITGAGILADGQVKVAQSYYSTSE